MVKRLGSQNQEEKNIKKCKQEEELPLALLIPEMQLHIMSYLSILEIFELVYVYPHLNASARKTLQ